MEHNTSHRPPPPSIVLPPEEPREILTDAEALSLGLPTRYATEKRFFWYLLMFVAGAGSMLVMLLIIQQRETHVIASRNFRDGFNHGVRYGLVALYDVMQTAPDEQDDLDGLTRRARLWYLRLEGNPNRPPHTIPDED